MKLFYQNEGFEMLKNEWKFEKCEHGQVRKHPTDCTKYLTCSFGTYLQELTCANGLHFSEVRLLKVIRCGGRQNYTFPRYAKSNNVNDFIFLFSQKRSTCDWPENADCKPSIMQYAESYFMNNLHKQWPLQEVVNRPGNSSKLESYNCETMSIERSFRCKKKWPLTV